MAYRKKSAFTSPLLAVILSGRELASQKPLLSIEPAMIRGSRSNDVGTTGGEREAASPVVPGLTFIVAGRDGSDAHRHHSEAAHMHRSAYPGLRAVEMCDAL
ncbi:hypothetical protein MRX96_006182 [Rhipicephalus microplus]